MRAVHFREYGDPDVAVVAAAPDPQPGPGEVRIQVRAASVNAIDGKIRSGALAGGEPLAAPEIVGFDAAGVVDAVGEGTTGVRVGDEVFGLGRHTHAEYAVLQSWAPKPAAIDWAVAAAAALAGETAERGLRLLGVGGGSTVFIDGGAGGVGAVAVQMARALGATVIASAGEGNQDYLREIGAIPVRYGEGVADRVRSAHGGMGAVRAAQGSSTLDAVLDVVGKTPIEDLISLVGSPSQVVSIANFQAAEAGARVTGGAADSQPFEALRLVADLLTANAIVVKFQTFPFDRAAEAYQRGDSGHGRGKVVLIP